jgi:hypothetical protein
MYILVALVEEAPGKTAGRSRRIYLCDLVKSAFFSFASILFRLFPHQRF